MIILYRDGVIQYIDGIINNTITDLIQFNDKLIDVAGSNVENTFLIIFNYNFLFFL